MYHIIRLTKSQKPNQVRFGLVLEEDSYLSGVKVFTLVDGHQKYYSQISAHTAAQELNTQLRERQRLMAEVEK